MTARVKQIDNPQEWIAAGYEWNSFSGATLDAALSVFKKRYPQFYDTAPVLVWVKSNRMLYVAMDVKR